MAIRKHEDPIELFKEWYKEVDKCNFEEPTAMTLATATPSGVPSARVVLLKGVDQRGFVFYTNLESQKGEQLRANPQAALCFHWMPLGKQIRVEGPVELVSNEEADAYFASRARDSQIGAWASRQSRPLASRFDLEKRIAEFALKFGISKVPRPPFWSGYRVIPQRIEFWKSGMFRLHDRLVYEKTDEGWLTRELFP
ncbi:MAG: pyridoxamine 5'-phosphate oxidase [Candidatus Hydrogenedentes bacterium]|nr:pyridoxamine 5'-phosphate oxidase [Candidatus Hydrogenedentota bacterium]